jgi:hypothetical protein
MANLEFINTATRGEDGILGYFDAVGHPCGAV